MTGEEESVEDPSEFVESHRGVLGSRESNKATAWVTEALIQFYGREDEGGQP